MAYEAGHMSADTGSPAKGTIDAARRVPSDLLSYLGIVVMTVLFGVIVGVAIVGMRQIQSTGEQIVQDRIEKIRLVQDMGVAARERTVLLQHMFIINDPFERDRLSLEYNTYGSRFVRARIALLAKELSDDEKNILERQGRISGVAVPYQNQIVDLIAANDLDAARVILADKAMPLQDQVLAALSDLMNYQTAAAHDSVTQMLRAFERGRSITITMSAAAAGIAAVLVWLVSKAARQRREYLDQVKAANRAKSSFLAKMSHEIRTPLTAIIGFAELALDSGERNDERSGALRTILSSGKHLLSIINDILDISKIEAEKFRVEKDRCSLFQILDDIAVLVRTQATAKGLRFDVNHVVPLPRYIETDPLRLKQIIINLCANAVKFTDRGRVSINVGFERSTQELTIEIEDTGIGMNSEEIGRLFQEFQQVDAGINRKYGGTGLGLAVSKKLAVLLGGHIAVTSNPGVGSVFKLTLPYASEPDEWVRSVEEVALQAIPRESAGAFVAKRYRGRVLVAEDSPQLRELIDLVLRHVGISAVVVENGQEAIDRAARESFDLVLMDIQMPVLDGVSAMRQLRERGYTVPVIAVTANAMHEEQAMYREVGFAGFLAKPIVRAQLCRVLDGYLESDTAGDGGEGAPIVAKLADPEDAFDEVMLQVVDKFVTELPNFHRQLANSLAARDWKAARGLAHQLAGMGGTMGYPVVSEIAMAMTAQIRAENFAESERLITRLGSVIARIVRGHRAIPEHVAAPASNS